MSDHQDTSYPRSRDDEDGLLLSRLAEMWQRHDPMPAELVEHVLVALATEDLDAEYELLHLVQRTDQLAGARGSADALTITFSGETFALLLRVSGIGGPHRRIDGWVTPAREMRVTVKQGADSWHADVDPHGRFELPQLPAGLSRCWLIAPPSVPQGEGRELFATPVFEL